MLGLPIYLRAQTYYLHTRIAGRQVKRTLGTGNKRLAIIRACHLLEGLRGMDLSKIRRYEIDLRGGVLKSDGAEDHQRMMEALALLQGSVAGAPPPKEDLPAKQAGLRLMSLLDKFFLLKTHLKQATVLSYKSTISEFSEFLKNPQVQNIGVSDISRFQEHLAKKKNGSRTIDSKIGTVRSLMNFALKQGYFFDKNPAGNRNLLSKRQKMSGGYGIFELSEISQIFKSGTFQTAKTTDPDYYWTLVLGLISGCRISEITSLTLDQFKISANGIPFIRILDSKSNAGLRDIPVPEFLFSADLGTFISGKTQIFKYKMRLGKGSGNAVGKRFSRHLAELNLTRPKLVFHSIRKFTNDFFLKQSVEFEARCQFFGHETNSVNIQTYTKKLTVEEIAERVSSPQLKLLMLSGILPTQF